MAEDIGLDLNRLKAVAVVDADALHEASIPLFANPSHPRVFNVVADYFFLELK